MKGYQSAYTGLGVCACGASMCNCDIIKGKHREQSCHKGPAWKEANKKCRY